MISTFRISVLTGLLIACVFHHVACAEASDDVDSANVFENTVRPFLISHCAKCHGKETSESGLRVDVLPRDFVAGSRDARAWQEIRDRMNLGEMPPEDEPRPDQSDVDAVNAWILKELQRAISESKDGAGRVVLRRLNRDEYNNTVQDLLGVNLRPGDVFPADNTAHGFDNIGRALTMSPLLMEKYMAAAQTLLNRAIVTGEPPKSSLRHVEVESLSRFFTRQKTLRTFNSGFMVRREDMLLLTRSKVFLPQIDSYRFNTEGDYAFRVRAAAVEGGNYPPRMVMEFDGSIIWEGDITAPDGQPEVIEVRIPVAPSTSGGRRVFKVAYSNFDMEHTMPLVLDFMEIEGPIHDEWPPASHHRIFFNGPDAELTSDYAREIIERFATRAYRRPLLEMEVDGLMSLFDEERKAGAGFEDAIKVALTAVLCSHDFLFLVEPKSGGDSSSRRLSDYELATRLSYFLWNSMPDDGLFAAAQAGELSDSAILEAQVRRMLRDPRSQRFVRSFVGQWLQTRLVGSFPPDQKLFPQYDAHLETSMVRETDAFFAEILHNDLSILNFIDSDFAMLNERLARHYGIEGVKGDELRRVTLPPDSHRGGVMTHASILTGLSDGTRTKPIKRGTWILENLLGDPPPPPPPNAGEIEPNKKGTEALSLRERMQQHRDNPACSSCHRKIDPLGFSLQNYDAVGAWRTHETGVAEPIDASGKLPGGQSFDGPDEFKALMLERKDDFCRCLAEKMLTYALGRGLEITDNELVESVSAATAKNDYRMIDMILSIVMSDAFQSK